MGAYLRTSIKVGPVRFNLSSAGVGISGARGFRVGTEARGNYISVGRQGRRYQAALIASNKAEGGRPRALRRLPPLPPGETSSEIDNDVAGEMISSSSSELLNEIRSKALLSRRWPLVFMMGVIVWLIAVAVMPWWMSLLTLCAVLGLTYRFKRRDELRKTVVLMYNLDKNTETAWQSFHNGFDWLASSQRTWHLEARGDVTDWKRNAGATGLVRRTAVRLTKADPPGIKTNLSVPILPSGRHDFIFWPDRILVFQGSAVGAVDYNQIVVETKITRFIENERVPSDAPAVGATWQYVNKNGGPDRRFNNNRQLPILQYGEIHLASLTGLNDIIQISNPRAPEHFVAGLRGLASSLAVEPPRQ
ncbi:MAG TPA: DUF4236 domain-containing protein [Thermoanaerobaculia bacterium]|jgi:hypothetical protein|nr:DUF4236 domain-containing protein [Thermoanaerobaculia bacterium]